MTSGPEPAPFAQPTQPPPPRSLLRGYTIEAVVLGCVVVFLVVAVVPTWLLGGFTPAPPKPLPTIQPGQTVSYGEYRITPMSARWSAKDPTALDLGDDKDKNAKPALIVTARITNLSKRPRYEINKVMQITPPAKTTPAFAKGTVLVRDKSGSVKLLPRLAENVELVWEMPKGATAPPGVQVTIMRETYRQGFFDKKYDWWDPHPWVHVTLPVKQESG